MAARQAMSLEAAIEEERKEIEALLLQRSSRSPPPSARSPSPFMSPRSPVRSMLDVAATSTDLGAPAGNKDGNGINRSPPQATFRSMLDVGPPPTPPIRSMLDIGGPSVAGSARTSAPLSAQTSPIEGHHRVEAPDGTAHHRSQSDAASKPAMDFGPRSPGLPLASPRYGDLTSYQFSDILPTNVGQALPTKRATSVHRSGSLGEALRGDIQNLVLPGDHSRGFSVRGTSKSKSPHNRFNLRSSSPHGSLLGTSAGPKSPPQGSFMLDNGQIVDMNQAYRRLSDANLIYGGSSLASLARKKTDAEGYGRIEKSNLSPYGEFLPDDESDDEVVNSSDEEDHRGRRMSTRAESQGSPEGNGRATKSLLAAAEEERKQISSQPQYRSLFEPEITVTGPAGDKTRKDKTSKQMVSPSTSFDQEPLSGSHTPLDPDLDADVSAINFAQKLQLTSTPVISTPEASRAIRILYRGDYNRIQREAEEEHRRLRKYLVATDLSEESTHALEWAIGTVLRDGDTMLAIYCMDEETSGSADAGALVPDEPKAMREQAAHINAMTKAGLRAAYGQRPSAVPAVRALDSVSPTPSPAPSSRHRSGLEGERHRAVQEITDRVSRLLRKTQLQVRVIVEVLHCKNPKHLITEVIDLVNPTLVILGSRGRSALKGTLLGSFSNYLVTKSSVPVMVARKRLRKKSKYQAPPLKQVNNLANPSARSLEMARID